MDNNNPLNNGDILDINYILKQNNDIVKEAICSALERKLDGVAFEIYTFTGIFLDEKIFLNYVNSGEMHNVKKYGGNYYGSFEEDIDNIIRENIEDNIFALTNAILDKNSAKAIKIYNDLLLMGEEPIKIIVMIELFISLNLV